MKKKWLVVLFLTLLCAACFTACGGKPKYAISVQDAQGGTVALSTIEATAGETVTVTCIPDEGYEYVEGTLAYNGISMQGYSFVMPEEDVIVTASFRRANYQGVYLYTQSGEQGRVFDFVEIKETTLTVGVTQEDFDYEIYEDIPYELDVFTLTAEVNGEAWSMQLNDESLWISAREYVLTADVSLTGAYTEIAEQINTELGEQESRFIERYYTFTDGSLITKTVSENGTTVTEIADYRLFGNFLYIEEKAFVNLDKQTRYGIVSDEGDYLLFYYTYYQHDSLMDRATAYTDGKLLYPKRTDAVNLRQEGGSYVLKEHYNLYSGESFGEPENEDFLCFDENGTLTFSKYGVYYDGEAHYYGEHIEYYRFGNVVRVYYTLDDKNFELTFHIINGDTLIVRDSANSVKKFVFTENYEIGS